MLARLPLVLLLLALVGGCGFRPLLSPATEAPVEEALAAVDVQGLQGRIGQVLENQLANELNPTALDIPNRYILQVQLQRTTDALAIQLDNTITRFNLTLAARFRLIDSTTNEILLNSRVERIASYNVRRAPYATLVAEQDAEERAAEEVGSNIRNVLAVHFARTQPT